MNAPARLRCALARSFPSGFRVMSGVAGLLLALEDLDDVALDHAYESNSGFRTAFGKLFGEPPGRSRTTECIVIAWIETPFGAMLGGATAAGICFLEFTDRRMLETQADTLRKQFGCAAVPGRNQHLEETAVVAAHDADHLRSSVRRLLQGGGECIGSFVEFFPGERAEFVDERRAVRATLGRHRESADE